jgi:mannose-6-phosphate isomerase-like protein (cupin superfamily)
VTLEEAIGRLPGPGGERSVPLFEHGTLVVKMYAPRGTDTQTPHTRDEVYVVARGSGEYVSGETRLRFSEGDFLFAPASVPHRFENFTDDFFVWVFFYGPEGGEGE